MAVQEGLYQLYYRYKIGTEGAWHETTFLTHVAVVDEPVVKAQGNATSNPEYYQLLSQLHPMRQVPIAYDLAFVKYTNTDTSVALGKLAAGAAAIGVGFEEPHIFEVAPSDRVYQEVSFLSDYSIKLEGNWAFGGGTGNNILRCMLQGTGNSSFGGCDFYWFQYSTQTELLYTDAVGLETGTYSLAYLGGGSPSVNATILSMLEEAEPYIDDKTTVTEVPSGSATYTVSTEGTTDTITISINEGYVLNTVALYDPQDRLVQRWKELPEGGVIQVRRDQPGEWTIRITCQEILSPYNPTVPIEDLPTDTITPTYPTDYIGKYIGAGFYKLFIPTVSQLNAFVNYLYTQTFMDAIMQLWNKMLGIEEMIVGVNIIPGAPAIAGTAIPKVGWVSMTESQAMNYTVQQYIEINLGSLTVSRAWGNYLDFAPYTKISIYLPFIGERTLDTNDVMGKTLNVRYNIDLLSGNCVAYVYVGGSIHYQFSGNCAYSIPISSADTANLFLQPLKAIAGLTLAGVGVATGNPMAVAAGNALGATVGSDENGTVITPPAAEISAPNVRKVDGLNANTGYMGTIRPYLSIERVKPDINAGFGQEIGYQSNKFRTLGTLAGFTKVSEVHLEGISATTAELTQIEAMLKEGVII